MKQPSKEQIEKIKAELPHPRDWMGDFYKVAWQDPEELGPIMSSRELKHAESYTVELLFRRFVDTNGHDMSWELDEGFKSFEEFAAEQIEQSQNPVDEYGIIEILKKHNAEGALNEIAAVFDGFCESYMGSREEIRKGAFTEVNCYLMTSLIEGRKDAEVLRSKIKDLVNSYNDLYTDKVHANKAK
mgnify:CR=1 FL=1